MSFQTADKATGPVVLPTGIKPLNSLLNGGLELGLTYLFYGDSVIRDILLRIAVHAQLTPERGGRRTPTIIIDSENMVNLQQITHYCDEMGLEPEDVMDNIFVSRAFNSSQTYDLVMTQLETFFERIPAKLLMLPCMADIYYGEGIDAEGNQHLTHMAHRLMTFSLRHGITTIITGSSAPKWRKYPAAGHAIKHSAQVHVYVEEIKERVVYHLMKHPQYPLRSEQEDRPGTRKIQAATLPLSFFIEGLE